MRILFVALLIAAITACGGPSIVKSYEDEAYTGKMTKILVLLPGLFPNSEQYASDQFVSAFEKRGIAVAMRKELFRASDRLTREKLIAAIADSDVDGVLLVDVSGSQQESRGRASFADTRGNYNDFEDQVGYLLSTGGSVAPVYRETQTDVYLRIRLFPESTKKLAWEEFLDFENPGSAFDLIDKAAPRIAQQVAASGKVVTR